MSDLTQLIEKCRQLQLERDRRIPVQLELKEEPPMRSGEGAEVSVSLILTSMDGETRTTEQWWVIAQEMCASVSREDWDGISVVFEHNESHHRDIQLAHMDPETQELEWETH